MTLVFLENLDKIIIMQILLLPIIFFQFIFAPIALYGKTDEENRQECIKRPGRTWNYELNSCAYDENLLNTSREMSKCDTRCAANPRDNDLSVLLLGGLGCRPAKDNQPAENELDCCKRVCVSTMAEQKVREKTGEGSNAFPFLDQPREWSGIFTGQQTKVLASDPDGWNRQTFMILNFIWIALNGVVAGLATAAADCWRAYSAAIMFLAALAAQGGEIGTWIAMTKGMQDNRAEYDKAAQGEYAKVQQAAFVAMEKNMNVKGDTEIARGSVYIVAAAAYFVAAGVAIYELWVSWGATCGGKISKPEDNPQSGILDKIKGSLAKAQIDFGPIIEKYSKLGQFIYSPALRIILAAICASFAIAMGTGALIVGQKSKDRALIIKDLREQFVQNWSQEFCTTRDDQGSPKCYCYINSGERDPLKVNSKICQDFWDKQKPPIVPRAKDYSVVSASPTGSTGCIAITNEFDQECRCQNLKDSKGNNACKKSNDVTAVGNLMGAGQSDVLKTLNASLNSIMSGQYNSPTMAPSSLQKLAIGAKKLAQDIYTKALPKLKEEYPNQFPITKQHMEGALAQLGSLIPKQTMKDIEQMHSETMGNAALFSHGLIDNEIEKKIDANKATAGAGPSYTQQSTVAKVAPEVKKNPMADFFKAGDNNPNAQGDDKIVGDEFGKPEEELKIKNADINMKENGNIFDIISGSYLKNAWKNFFP